MVFERDGAGKTPLEVSIKSLATDSPVVVAIWEVMENSGYEKIKEHFGQEETKDILHICATHGQNYLLLKIAQTIEKSDILLRKNEEERTVFDLCNNQHILCQLLERLSTHTKIEDVLKDIRDKNKKKNLLHHWASKNFDDAIDCFIC